MKTARIVLYEGQPLRRELIIEGNRRYASTYVWEARFLSGHPETKKALLFLSPEAVLKLHEALGVRIAELKAAGHVKP